METSPEYTSQGFPSDQNPSPFPSFGNVGAPYMETLSLTRLTIGLPIWLFFISVVPSVLTLAQTSPSFESRHVDSKVDLSRSSHISSPSSSTSPGESFKSSNQKAKKKKMKTKKKKEDKQEANHATISLNALPVDRPFDPPRKVRFPYKLCKSDHLLQDCPGIPRA